MIDSNTIEVKGKSCPIRWATDDKGNEVLLVWYKGAWHRYDEVK